MIKWNFANYVFSVFKNVDETRYKILNKDKVVNNVTI